MRFSTRYKRKSKINVIFDLGLDIKPIRKLKVLKNNRMPRVERHTIPIRIKPSSDGIYTI